MTGIPEATPIKLTKEERAELEGLARSTKTEHRLRQRARVVLLAADGMETRAIGRAVGCTTGIRAEATPDLLLTIVHDGTVAITQRGREVTVKAGTAALLSRHDPGVVQRTAARLTNPAPMSASARVGSASDLAGNEIAARDLAV